MARNRKGPPEQSIIDTDGWANDEAWRGGHEAWLQGLLGVCEEAAEKYGYAPAVMDALKLCIDEKRPLPDWLAGEIWAAMVHLYNKPKNRKRFDLMTAHREKHLARWDAVTDLRERREELAARELHERKKLAAISYETGHLPSFKTTWDAAFTNAASLEPGISEDAITKSYKMVRKALKSGDAARFYVADFNRPKPKTRVKKTVKKS